MIYGLLSLILSASLAMTNYHNGDVVFAMVESFLCGGLVVGLLVYE